MLRRIIVSMAGIWLVFMLASCGAERENMSLSQPGSESGLEVYTESGSMPDVEPETIGGSESEPAIHIESGSMSDAVEESAGNSESEPVTGMEDDSFTFADLTKLRFEFSSGAGAWGEEFMIEPDGTFTGLFHDSDMGDVGEDYPNGTRYSSSYTGYFTDLTQINEYTYTMELRDISYKEPAQKVEILDGVRYIYTESYCLGAARELLVYLPGTPLSELSEEVKIWLSLYDSEEPHLTMTVLVDPVNQYGIYSYERE